MNSTDFSNFNPSACISNRVKQVNRVIANIYRKHLTPFHITDSQLTLLFVLCKRGRLTQKEICQILHLEKSSVHRNLHRLFERQLASKDHFPLIEITTEGVALVKAIIPAWNKAMEETKKLLKDDGMQAVDLLTHKIH